MDIVRDTPQFCLYLLWFATDSLQVHSCDARTKDGEGVDDVCGFDGAVIDSVVPHHFHKLGIIRVANHGLCLAGCNGVLDFMLGEAFVMLADGLNHGHSIYKLHVNVGQTTAYTILLLEEGDFFAPGGGDNPVATMW